MLGDLFNEGPIEHERQIFREILEESYRTWMVQSVEARAKAVKYNRKRLRRAERCAAAAAALVERSRQTSLHATLLCECYILRIIGFGPRDHFGT